MLKLQAYFLLTFWELNGGYGEFGGLVTPVCFRGLVWPRRARRRYKLFKKLCVAAL